MIKIGQTRFLAIFCLHHSIKKMRFVGSVCASVQIAPSLPGLRAQVTKRPAWRSFCEGRKMPILPVSSTCTRNAQKFRPSWEQEEKNIFSICLCERANEAEIRRFGPTGRQNTHLPVVLRRAQNADFAENRPTQPDHNHLKNAF
jgi:hypothetical protein